MGHTWIITPALVNSLRYGFTRQSYDNTGVQTQPILVGFTDLDNPSRLHHSTQRDYSGPRY